MKLFRRLNKLYANVFGYFWLPCPVCGEDFGGHEIANMNTRCVVDKAGRCMSVCTKESCNEVALRLYTCGPYRLDTMAAGCVAIP